MDSFFEELSDLYKKGELADGNNGIIKDGIIDDSKYEKQNCKVLFIAKEHNRINDSYESGDCREWCKSGVRYNFSHRLSEWAYGILHNFPSYDSITHSDKEEALQSIAFINIKKTWGDASSDAKVLSKYISSSQNYLYQQIHTISPTIILCCFHYDYLTKQLFEFQEMHPTPYGFSYAIWQDCLVINFFHPSARKNKSSLYTQLKEVVNFAILDSNANIRSRH